MRCAVFDLVSGWDQVIYSGQRGASNAAASPNHQRSGGSKMATTKLCAVEGCGKPTERRQWCGKHYQRWMRHGDAAKTKRYEGATCSVADCGRPARAYGLCGTHAQRKRRHGDPMARPAVRRSGCLVEGCDRKHVARGYCILHYQRLLFAGDVKAGMPPRLSPGTRQRWLLEHVDHEGADCLTWPFSRDHQGYGRVTMDGASHTASRVMCELAHGRPPEPHLQAAHNCGNGHLGCTNPGHLRWDTVVGNHADKLVHGTHIQGEDQWLSKLTRGDVLEIRRLSGATTQRELGERFGVNQSTIGKIQRRFSWAWLD